MIIVINSNGDILNRTLENLYQGSNDANKIYIIAPLSASLVCKARIKTARATSEEFLAVRSVPISDSLNTWYFDLEHAVSQYYGSATLQFAFYNVDQIITSCSTKIEIQRGADVELPAEPTTDVYVEILAALSQVLGDLDNKVNINYLDGDNEQTVINDATGLKFINTDGTDTTTIQITPTGFLVNGLEIASEQYVSESISNHNSSETAHNDIRLEVGANTANIATNTDNIATNAENIATNTSNIQGLKDGTFPIDSCANVSETIADVLITDIFEEDGITAKKATADASGRNIEDTYVESLILHIDINNFPNYWDTAENKEKILAYINNQSKYTLILDYNLSGSFGDTTYNLIKFNNNVTTYNFIFIQDFGGIGNFNAFRTLTLTYTVDTTIITVENTYSYNFENTSNKVTSFGESPTDTQYPSAKLVKDTIDGLNADSAYSFDTYNNFIDWLAGTYTRSDGVLPSALKLGNQILLKETDKPDYWYSDNVTEPITILNFSEFEGKIDLTNYVEKLEIMKELVGEDYTWDTAQNKSNILLFKNNPSKYNLMFIPGTDGVLGTTNYEYPLLKFSYTSTAYPIYILSFKREMVDDVNLNYTETSIKYDTLSEMISEIEEETAVETSDNKTISITSISTNIQYPSAKAVYDQLSFKIGGNTIYGGTISNNFDTITKSGFYTGYGTATGAPNSTYSWFVLHENSNVNTESATQKAVAYYSTVPIVYIRTKTNSTWGAWVKITTEKDTQTYTTTLPTTSGGASDWQAVTGGYELAKTISGLTIYDSIVTVASDDTIWTDNELNATITTDTLTFFVSSLPSAEVELTLTITKSTNGGVI